jgi:hypothetical protein
MVFGGVIVLVSVRVTSEDSERVMVCVFVSWDLLFVFVRSSEGVDELLSVTLCGAEAVPAVCDGVCPLWLRETFMVRDFLEKESLSVNVCREGVIFRVMPVYVWSAEREPPDSDSVCVRVSVALPDDVAVRETVEDGISECDPDELRDVVSSTVNECFE